MARKNNSASPSRPKPYSSAAMRSSERSGIRSGDVKALFNPVATTGDGRDITRPFVKGLQQPSDQRLMGAIDWGVYDRILEDDQVFSTVQQRIGAVVSRNWNVIPGDSDDPRSVEAADALGKTLKRIGWDRITRKMLYAVFYGYSVGEVMWEAGGLLDFGNIHVRHARRFRYDDEDRLRMLTRGDMTGELMPERKFWVITAGASDDDELYGRGLAEWLYWPTLFKRNGIRFWNNFIDKYSSPTAVGKYRPGTPRSEIENLLGALQAIATDTGIVIPDGMAMELLTIAKTGTNDFENIARYMDEAITKVVLSQTMTTQNGSSLSQAQVHEGVKKEVVQSDADLVSDSFNGGPARWWTDLNYGRDVASPLMMRDFEEEIDTKNSAETDKTLAENGWHRTDESFREIYGDGYERGEASATKTADKKPSKAANDDGADDTKPGAKKSASFTEQALADPGYLMPDRGDILTDELIEGESARVADAMTGDLFERIAAATSAQELDDILASSVWANMDDEPLRLSLERASFALRLEEENGEGEASS